MFCKYCGNQIEDDSVFCVKCGKKLNEPNSTEVNNNNSYSSPSNQYSYTQQPQYNYVEKMMTRAEFVEANPHLKSKEGVASVSYALYSIATCIIAIAMIFRTFEDYNNSLYKYFDDGLILYIEDHFTDWLFPLFFFIILDVIVSIVVNANKADVNDAINREYDNYISNYRNAERNRVPGAVASFHSYATNNGYPGHGSKLANGEWQCRRCGKIHSYYVGSCGCGELRPDPASQSAPININRAPQNANRISNSWDCPKCGNIVSGSARICANCGQSKPR